MGNDPYYPREADDANDPADDGRKDTPTWVPKWFPQKPSLDYCKTAVETVIALIIGFWLIYHLTKRGPMSLMARVAPGGNSP